MNRTRLQLVRSYHGEKLDAIPFQRSIVEFEPHLIIGIELITGAIGVKEPFNFVQDVEEIVLPRSHNLLK